MCQIKVKKMLKQFKQKTYVIHYKNKLSLLYLFVKNEHNLHLGLKTKKNLKHKFLKIQGYQVHKLEQASSKSCYYIEKLRYI